MKVSKEYARLVDAVQYGFEYAIESQNDGKAVPQGNVDQFIMYRLGFKTREEFENFKFNK